MDHRLMFWTADRVEQLKNLWAHGVSCRGIADEMECGRNAVIGKIYRLKLPHPFSKQVVAHCRPAPRQKPSRPAPIAEPDIIAVVVDEPAIPEKPMSEVFNGTHIKIGGLTKFTCRWPIGDPKTPEFEYCGARAVAGTPYCAGHCELAYQPPYCRYRADKALS